jgi:hypothetical protein
MKDEITELNNVTPAPAEDEGNGMPRRLFFGNLAGVLGTTAAIGAVGALGLTAKGQEQTQAKEIKGKILSRIQQQLNQEPGEEGMQYLKADEHHKGGAYQKGPAPVQPDEE